MTKFIVFVVGPVQTRNKAKGVLNGNNQGIRGKPRSNTFKQINVFKMTKFIAYMVGPLQILNTNKCV
jgi:hypothetical protein